MKVIGVTGGVGTGKSTVLSILENDYNAKIIEADKVAHFLMEPDKEAYTEIVHLFGEDILYANREINRNVLGSIVFNDSHQLLKLNSIVHPAVKKYIQNQIYDAQTNGEYKYVIIEAALLIEDGYKSICDELWSIYTDKSVRIDRLMSSRGYDYDKCISIINSQNDDEFYKSNCDYIIDNTHELNNTKNIIFKIMNNQI